jgi:hypothetical protein
MPMDTPMSDDPNTRDQQIAAIEAALRLPLPEDTRLRLIADLRAMGAVPAGEVRGVIELRGDARIDGVAIAVNLGTIIYGHAPSDEQHEQLTRYLQRLAAKLQRLPLRGLAAQLDEGPGIALPKVYVLPATLNRVEVARDGVARFRMPVASFYKEDARERLLKADYDPAYALPERAIIAAEPFVSRDQREELHGHRLYRALLATEALEQHRRLVLLGDPGGGKSTTLRHLAWALAQRGLDQLNDATKLIGWDDETRLLPIILPLRTLAGRLAAEGAQPASVSAALRDEMTRAYDVRQADELLDKALASGSALLLFDGLDEVPRVAVPAAYADRLTTLQAVRDFAELHPGARVVLTCRTRAFDEPLRTALGWPVETLASFTLGQMRHFIADWFATLVERGSLTPDSAAAQQATLIDAISTSERLRAIAATPLLLTMMALVLAEGGELPRDQPLLYERIVEQMLGQWDQQKGGQSLADILGAPNLRSDDLRPILDELSYRAHAGADVQDGYGRLTSKELRYTLAEFLEKIQVAGAWEAAGRCLAYFNERSGLLLAEEQGETYAFAHLTLQEHGAGRHMLLQPNAVELVMRHRSDEHWREPIALGLGVVQKRYAPLADRIDRILTELIDPDEHGAPKPRISWYRDLILAAEIGDARDWRLLRALINVDRLQRDLRRGLVALLNDPAQPLPVAERVRAGFLLGDLGDPRFPTTIAEWRRALADAQAGKTDGYFCPIPPRAGAALRWIGRYPITNAQVREWVRTAALPPRSHAADANFNRPNQPAAGVSWWRASAFCAWLSEQTRMIIRLPSEAEWEDAARGPDERRYPWGNQRRRDRAATKEDHDLRAWPYTVPVGCYPAGAAACGALDMAGNVWEWTADVYQSDTAGHGQGGEAARALRGGGYLSTKSQTLATARIGLAPGRGFDNGFRVVLELPDRASGD